MPSSKTISIRYAGMNELPVTKKIKAGTKLKDFAESISAEVDQMFVNGKKGTSGQILKTGDFVTSVKKVSGGSV